MFFSPDGKEWVNLAQVGHATVEEVESGKHVLMLYFGGSTTPHRVAVTTDQLNDFLDKVQDYGKSPTPMPPPVFGNR